MHLDPSIYLVDNENRSAADVHAEAETKETKIISVASDDNATNLIDDDASMPCNVNDNSGFWSSKVGIIADQVGGVSKSMEPVDLAASASGDRGLSLSCHIRFWFPVKHEVTCIHAEMNSL